MHLIFSGSSVPVNGQFDQVVSAELTPEAADHFRIGVRYNEFIPKATEVAQFHLNRYIGDLVEGESDVYEVEDTHQEGQVYDQVIQLSPGWDWDVDDEEDMSGVSGKPQSPLIVTQSQTSQQSSLTALLEELDMSQPGPSWAGR